MSKHYFFSTLIGVDKQFHLIRIICLSAAIIGSQIGFDQLQIIQDAHAISQQPAAVVQIRDSNLRAAIAEALGKNLNTPITTEEMATLGELDVPNRGIQDLTGLQFATNLRRLMLGNWGTGNQVSDISLLAGLIHLRELWLSHNPVSDLSPLRGLDNLTRLEIHNTQISDLSPIAGLISLQRLGISHANVSDLSPIAGLINLERFDFHDDSISDISPLAQLINLKEFNTWGNPISDISPIAQLSKLESVNICDGDLPDLTPLVGLTGLKELYLANNRMSDISPLARLAGLERLSLERNEISDISPLAGLTNLEWINLGPNEISDISPLAGLVNLKWLDLSNNQISNFSPLDGIRENIKLIWHGNPAFPQGGPKIEGPWLWVLLLDTELNNTIDLLSAASAGTVTEQEVATHGAIEGKPVGDDVWTAHRLPPAGHKNIEDMLQRSIRDAVLYGSVSLHSPQQQDTTMYVGGEDGVKVWLNGNLVYDRINHWRGIDYQDFFPVTLKQGRNVLLVAIPTLGTGFFGFEPGTEYIATNSGISYTFSKTPIHTGDTFTLDIGARDFFDLAGWQLDINFDPTILEAVNVIEGNFLKMDGASTFFQTGTINNATGKITGFTAARTSTGGLSGTGTLLQVTFKAKTAGETALALQNVELGTPTGDIVSAGPHEIRIVVGGQLATGDVNRDGTVTILDLILIARQLGQRVSANSPADLNGDGSVSILDLILAARSLGSTTAPAAPPIGGEHIDAATIAAWIAQARLEDDGSLTFKEGIEMLENLLASLIPEETALLANYPNPFNPETWIPYQLANSAEVTLTIYDMNGQRIRRIAIGHRAAGMYRNRARAAYWDGHNQLGEPVASGLYFYTLTAHSETGADEFTATRKMLILK